MPRSAGGVGPSMAPARDLTSIATLTEAVPTPGILAGRSTAAGRDLPHLSTGETACIDALAHTARTTTWGSCELIVAASMAPARAESAGVRLGGIPGAPLPSVPATRAVRS